MLVFCLHNLILLFALLSLAHAGNTATQTGNWSNTATWGGALPTGSESDLIIPSGITVTLDQNFECGNIIVRGVLQVNNITANLKCDSLIVEGPNARLRAGTNTTRFTGQFNLTLKGQKDETYQPVGHTMSMGARALVAIMGGGLSYMGEIVWNGHALVHLLRPVPPQSPCLLQ